MERTSILYKTRRKLQILAHKLISNEALSKFYFKIVLNKKLDLKAPKTFNEKLQWLKLYYLPNNPLAVQCSDKYAVRDYIVQKGYGDKLVPLIGVWDNANDIIWDELPDKFILKCNHGCAYNILCSDKSSFDKNSARKQLNKWLKEDFGAFNVETHYSKIKERKIVCEEYLGECITDYKFFCFNGVPYCMYVSVDFLHDRQTQLAFFNFDGTRMPIKRDDYHDISIDTLELPPFFDEMKNMATELSKDFPFVRVDFFIANDTYYFAELTFTPGACMMPFNPDKYDLEWGNMLDISNLMEGK